MSAPKTIEKLYAWVVTEPDGGHGIPAIKLDDLMVPLVGADMERIESFRDFAMDCLGYNVPGGRCFKVELVEFSGRKVLETWPR